MAVDPIFCVRDAWQDGRLSLSEDDTHFIFRDGITLPKDFKTVLRGHGGTKDPLTLRTLVMILRHKDLPHGRFKATVKGISDITYPDRKDMEAFLTGQQDTTSCLPVGLTLDAAAAMFEPPAKRLRTGDGSLVVPAAAQEASALAEVLGRERRLRDRNTQLLVPGKSFKRVLDILANAQNKQDKERAAQKGGNSRKDSHGSHRSSSSVFGASRRTEENGHGVPPPPPPGMPPSGSRPPRPLSEHQGSSSASRSRPPHSSSKHGPSPHKSRDKRNVRGQLPIIIVPAAATANINMANAKEFLQNGVYRQPRDDGAPRPTEEMFMRTIGRKPPGVPYVVTSKAPEKRSEDWRRVVAVFVTGQAWQFKGWPHDGIEKGNFAHALSKMLGVYVGLKGELLPPNVKQWNVLKLEVPKDDRHKDRPIVAEIFAAIDKFLAAHRSELAY